MEEKQPLSRMRRVGVIFVLSLALAIIILDGTILNVSFGYILRDLNTTIKSLQWVITAYTLTIAALTVTGGRLGDLFGRKRMFISGAILFAIGSFTASESHSVTTMIIGESIIEGVGAALMMPATASLLASTFQGPARAMAMGIWGGVAGAAAAVGPVIGGYLTTNYSWRWGFRINIFVVILLIVGSYIINEYRDTEEKPKLDVIGVILSSLGLFSLVFGIIQSSTYGWLKAKDVFAIGSTRIDLGTVSIVVPALILAVILLVTFVLWELKVSRADGTPLVNMDIFKNKQFTPSVATTATMSLAQAGLIFSVPIFFQAVRELDAYHTGLAIMPGALAALVTAPIAALLTRRFHAKRIVQAGIAVNAAALLLIHQELTINSTARDILPAMLLYGIGIGLAMAQTNNMIMSSVSVQQAGEASGVNNTLRQIGSTLGTAIIGAALITALTTNISNGIRDSKKIPAPMKPAIEKAVASQSSNIEFGSGLKTGENIPAPVKEEIKRIANEATTNSARRSLIFAEIFLIAGLLVTTLIPNITNVEINQSLAHLGKKKT